MKIEEYVTDNFSLYNGDCVDVMPEFPDKCIHLSVYSPPFNDLYAYSSSNRDLGNCKTYEEFLEHYEFVVKEIARLTIPGRMTCVHCMDIPKSKKLVDFPGDIIRLHEKNGFDYWDRKNVWKEPLRVAIRTRQRSLMHGQIVKDSTMTRSALADYILTFKRKGENTVPVFHEFGLTEFVGDFQLLSQPEKEEYSFLEKKYQGWTEDKTNKLSQWIWRRYASSNWSDIRANRMVEYKPAKEDEDERHVCPLHLDLIERLVVMYSNKGEVVLTPFGGVGSETYMAVKLNRKGIGIELKQSYFKQNIKNTEMALLEPDQKNQTKLVFGN